MHEDLIIKGLLGIAIVGVISLIVIAPFAIMAENESESAFMAECLADNKKQYECTAMWRAGENNTAVMPMPVIIR